MGWGMNFRDSNGDSSDGKYICKRVMVNGQFVTLYSTNGQTWLSSPEDIPALMERLENARITLNPEEKGAEGEGGKVAAKESAAEDDKAAAAPKPLQTKYRIKGPKPRPILRQGGVVIRGTPIEPISASSASISFSSDSEYEAEDDKSARSPKDKLKDKQGKKLAGATDATKRAKGGAKSDHKKLVAPVLQKPLAAKAAKAKSAVVQDKSASKRAATGAPKLDQSKGVSASKASVSKKAELKVSKVVAVDKKQKSTASKKQGSSVAKKQRVAAGKKSSASASKKPSSVKRSPTKAKAAKKK